MWPEKVRQDRPREAVAVIHANSGLSSGHIRFFSPRSQLTFHDRDYWMRRQKRSLDMAISLVSPGAKLNIET
jgi:hypothetical protein